MSDVVIKIENLSKLYRLGLVSTGTLGHDINRFWAKMRGKEDPYLKIGETNDRSVKGDSEYVLALKDINLEVKRGERIGIIGKNGAGKSTLLKILSQVTGPTKGVVKMKGCVGSLLEVGTGFHGELTGRENIYMNGTILGMSHKEVSKKFDEIVDFAGVERYIDTPVKRYSSGMTVRLGFAVAAHLEPDILIVDEVLAVGDAEFQKKAIGKMKDVSEGQGRTILFVSHNMTAVKSLCEKAVLLKDGQVELAGATDRVINDYLTLTFKKSLTNNHWDFNSAPGTDYFKVKSAYTKFTGCLTVNTAFDIVTEFWNLCESLAMNVSMHVYNEFDVVVFAVTTKVNLLSKGLYKAVFNIPANFMNDGVYYIRNVFVSDSKAFFIHNNAISFEIYEERKSSNWHGKWPGYIRPTFIKSKVISLN
jgi:lipopolysaccharide transport system ATP-binding protein